jgi:hypothetical protein
MGGMFGLSRRRSAQLHSDSSRNNSRDSGVPPFFLARRGGLSCAVRIFAPLRYFKKA